VSAIRRESPRRPTSEQTFADLQHLYSCRDFDNDKEWNWFRSTGPFAVKNIDKFSAFESRGGEGENEQFELIVKDGWPTKTLSNRPNGDYATSDAFLKVCR